VCAESCGSAAGKGRCIARAHASAAIFSRFSSFTITSPIDHQTAPQSPLGGIAWLSVCTAVPSTL
jgi:hypothetical protein